MTAMTLPHTNGSSAFKPSDAWLHSTVQEFFLNFNWDGAASPDRLTTPQTTTSTSSEPLSLEMSVGRFFAAFNWDGTAIAAPPPPPLSDSTPSANSTNSFTLDEFSDLF